jgi:1-acyl-sn-glycerol-3-phosphate acyltransferase
MARLLGHRYLRRCVTVPAVLLTLFLLVTTLPLWAIAAAAVSPRLPGRWRPLRLLWFVIVYLALQGAGIVAATMLWLRSGFGRHLWRPDIQALHYRLLGVLLATLMRAARRAFKLHLAVDAEPLPDAKPQVERDDPRPLLVLSRHAGPGDSFLLVHELMSVYDRRPRIVLKNTLQWDPVVDLLLNRLPTRFISPGPGGGGAVTATIGALAAELRTDEAMIIFPEGGNFTEGRRLRAIERLDQAGLAEHAERARGMRHLLAPRPGGTFAAIDAVPSADVVFVAHTGLEQLSTVWDLWRGLPMDADVRARMWTVPAEEVPDDPDARMDWLYDWWERMDRWIATARTPPPAATSGPDVEGG